MARIRSIHPGLWTDEAFVSTPSGARLLFIGLLNECDDQGVFQWSPLRIKMRLAPADNVDVAELLSTLADANLIRKYEVSGSSFGAVRNFRKWQRPEKPKAVHPLPASLRAYVAMPEADKGEDDDSSGSGGTSAEPDSKIVRDVSPTSRRMVADKSPNGSGKSPQREEGGGRREEERTLLRNATAGAAARADPPPMQPPDARAAVWSEGLATYRRLTGRLDGPARKRLGRLLRDARDDCAGLLAALRSCPETGDPDGWLTAAVQARASPRLSTAAQIRSDWSLPSFLTAPPDDEPEPLRLQ